MDPVAGGRLSVKIDSEYGEQITNRLTRLEADQGCGADVVTTVASTKVAGATPQLGM